MDPSPSPLSNALELLRRHETLVSSLIGGPREVAARHLLYARLRLVHHLDAASDTRLSIDASTRMDLEGALAALESLAPQDILSVLTHLQPDLPPSSGLIAIARKQDISNIETSAPVARLAVSLWAGLDVSRGDADKPLDPHALAAALASSITPTHPDNADALSALLDKHLTNDLDSEVRAELSDIAIARWFTVRDFHHSDAEFALLDRLSDASAWLVTLSAMLARAPMPRSLAESFIPRAEPAWREASTPTECALADARLAAIVGAAGDMPSAEGLLRHALAGLDQENDLIVRAGMYEVILSAASALPTRQLDAPGLGPWLDAIDKLLADRALLRSRQAFFLARLAALRTLPRIARVIPEVIDRGQQSLRELCRRVPERWLDLLHLATTAHLQSLARRSTELQIANLSDTLRRDGLPEPHPSVRLEEIVTHLAGTAPEHLARLAERIPNPAARAHWLEASIGVLGARG
jgi:hypothetical protein